jgi:hypothetical protein
MANGNCRKEHPLLRIAQAGKRDDKAELYLNSQEQKRSPEGLRPRIG